MITKILKAFFIDAWIVMTGISSRDVNMVYSWTRYNYQFVRGFLKTVSAGSKRKAKNPGVFHKLTFRSFNIAHGMQREWNKSY